MASSNAWPHGPPTPAMNGNGPYPLPAATAATNNPNDAVDIHDYLTCSFRSRSLDTRSAPGVNMLSSLPQYRRRISEVVILPRRSGLLANTSRIASAILFCKRGKDSTATRGHFRAGGGFAGPRRVLERSYFYPSITPTSGISPSRKLHKTCRPQCQTASFLTEDPSRQ